jgi:ribonucleotide reductase beta subunit family protein with ferritin-like domain
VDRLDRAPAPAGDREDRRAFPLNLICFAACIEGLFFYGDLEYVADRRLAALGLEPEYGSKNPFAFMELQDVQELSNFFERRVSAYQVAVPGTVSLDEEF